MTSNKNPVNTRFTGLKSGVGDNDEKLNFLVFIGLPKGAVFRGNRIGLDLTNFNIWIVRISQNSSKWHKFYFFDL